jgi:hypothetical protein
MRADREKDRGEERQQKRTPEEKQRNRWRWLDRRAKQPIIIIRKRIREGGYIYIQSQTKEHSITFWSTGDASGVQAGSMNRPFYYSDASFGLLSKEDTQLRLAYTGYVSKLSQSTSI